MNNIYMISGGKGGVGKSFFTMSLLDYIEDIDKEILVIDADTSNPDVYKAYKDIFEFKLLDLDNKNGWIDLLNILDEYKKKKIIVNCPARNEKSIISFGNLLNNSLKELERNLITAWIINRQRDCLELLNRYSQVMTNSLTHVVRNCYFGSEERFELYNSSKTKTNIESNNGISLNFPDLADRIVDEIYTNRQPIKKILKISPLGNRAEILRWKNEVKKTMEQII